MTRKDDAMITHETRRDSHRITDKSTRHRMILEAFRAHGEMTAREVGHALGFYDLNAVKPRITELCGKGLLVATGKKYDGKTKRTVATFAAVEDKP